MADFLYGFQSVFGTLLSQSSDDMKLYVLLCQPSRLVQPV